MGDVIPDESASGEKKQARQGREEQLRSVEQVHSGMKRSIQRPRPESLVISPTGATGEVIGLSEQGKGRTRNVCAARRLAGQSVWIDGGEWG